MLNTMILFRATMVRTGDMASPHDPVSAQTAQRGSARTKRRAMIAGSLLALAATAALADFIPVLTV